MNNLRTYIINEIEYYNSIELKKSSELLFDKCYYIRDIIKKKNIPETEYTYGRYIDGKLIEYNGNNKKLDKLYITKRWVKSQEIKIKMVPNIIENEKYFNSKIEIRGDNENTYFNIKDIMRQMNCKSLKHTITDKNHNGYIKNIHYIYFMKKIKNKLRKTLYLTYLGFHRFIHNYNDNEKKMSMILWLSQFNPKIEKYEINIEKINNKITE